MQTVAVIGTQWGDEGKGKIVDLLAADTDLVVRFQGGNNAAHTLVVNGEKFILRMIPAGALHPGKVCVIGNGMVIDPFALVEEIDRLRAHSHLSDRALFKISCDAHLVMPYHQAIDRAREQRLGRRKVGTTGFGIGPAYEDKMARSGLRFADLLKPAAFKTRLEYNLKEKNLYLKRVLQAKPIDGKRLLAQIGPMRRRLLPYLTDTAAFVAEAVAAGRRVLFEGAHGTMLDIDHGTYPFVTSSNCVASAVFSGGGLPPGRLEAVLGISKAYTTRVGGGPFPTEIKGSLGNRLREEGDEFGSATGRPRRIGWFDAVLARYAARLNGMWGLALTKLDVLTGVNPLRIGYAYQIGSRQYDEMPAGRTALEKARPLYEELPGWNEDISGARSLADLPVNARRYLDRIVQLGGVKLAMVGVGAGREAIIVLDNPFLT
ncbi:MAG TPA: adenylosuccinate synthase [Candidatus Binataceae bacterium]|nr:adenylosuccinate synthase [Candidatus Binataceae bacterium]